MTNSLASVRPARLRAARVFCVALLALGLAPAIAGCTPAQFGAGLVVTRAVVHYTCAGARKLCEITGHEDHEACRFVDTTCDALGEPGPVPVSPVE